MTVWLIVLAVLLACAAAAVCAAHIPGLRGLVDPGPYTDTTETDTSWLRELPAVESRPGDRAGRGEERGRA